MKKRPLTLVVGAFFVLLFAVIMTVYKVQNEPETKSTKEVIRLQQESASEVQQTEFVYELEINPTFPE